MEPNDLLCSRNARSQTPLVGRAQWKINQPPSLERNEQACLFPLLGMAPALVPLRPSNEHILIVRVPGARDQRGCHSLPFCLTALRPFVTLRADWRQSPNKTEIS